MLREWIQLPIIALAALVCLGAASCTPREPEAQADPVARGAYLVSVTGCGDCHTPGTLYGAPDTSRALSGSELGWQGAWGTSFARNITPDPSTGIGAWSEQDIVTALRTGKRPDGRILFPPMPWPDLAHLTDEDAFAIAKYLKSIPPVTHKVPDRVGPGVKVGGSILVFPPPSAWDAPRTPPQATP